MMSKLRSTAAIAILLMLLAACGSEDEAAPEAGEPVTGDGVTVEVSAFDFGFDPATISLDAGEEVTLAFENNGEAPHTFTADDLEVDIRAEAGGSGEATVTAPADGTYPFRCAIHPDRMTGEIIVGTGGAGADEGGTGEGEAENDDGLDY